MRIVSLSPSITDVLVSLGLEDELVGVTPFCLPWLRSRGLGDIALVGDYLRINVSKLKSLRPDVIFLQSHVHDKFLDELLGTGFRAYLIDLPTSVFHAISEAVKIADLVSRGLEGRILASKVIEDVSRYLKDIVSRDLGFRPRVYVEYLWPNWTYTTTGALTFANDMVWIAGGLNIFYKVIAKFFEPRDEDILNSRPDVVLVNVEPQMKVNLREYLSRRPTIAKLSEAGTKVFLIRESRDVNLAHWGPTALASTIRWVHEVLSTLTPKPKDPIEG